MAHSQVENLNNFFVFVAGAGIAQYSTAVPSGSFVPIYPMQQSSHYPPDVVVTKPIQPLPVGVTYGSIVQPNVVPTEIIVINGCPACRIGVLE